jgi:hypothetical protein
MTDTRSAGTPPILAVGADDVAAAVDRAIDRYVAGCHDRVGGFVDATYSLRGSLRLHRAAIGWDLLRAPANLALAAPALALRVLSTAGRRAQWDEAERWLAERRLFFTTEVGRELEWRLVTELLGLPYVQAKRRHDGDALAAEILDDPAIAPAIAEAMSVIARRANDPRFRDWLAETLATYGATRVAAGDLATSLAAAAAGGAAFNQFTPGLVSLAPLVAGALAQKIAAVPLGAGVASFWTATAARSGALAAGLTGGLMAVATVMVAFSGVVTDPVQRRLGMHQRRLHRLIDCLELELKGRGDSRFTVRDHYVARVLDLLDVLRAARRLAGG